MPPNGTDQYDEPPPVHDPDAIRVVVGIGGRSQTWRAVSDLAEAGPDDAVYAIDDETGHVIFGDGEHGRRPPPEAVVQVRYRDGLGAGGQVTGQGALIGGYDYGFQPTPTVATPPGRIRQIESADGWFAVELHSGVERLIPLVGWALLDPYLPPYRNGNEPALITIQSVRGLIAPKGQPVRIVDELSAQFGGYRR